MSRTNQMMEMANTISHVKAKCSASQNWLNRACKDMRI